MRKPKPYVFQPVPPRPDSEPDASISTTRMRRMARHDSLPKELRLLGHKCDPDGSIEDLYFFGGRNVEDIKDMMQPVLDDPMLSSD